MESDQHVAVKSERNDTSFECCCDEGSTVEHKYDMRHWSFERTNYAARQPCVSFNYC